MSNDENELEDFLGDLPELVEDSRRITAALADAECVEKKEDLVVNIEDAICEAKTLLKALKALQARIQNGEES
jgi:hypothetical protein